MIQRIRFFIMWLRRRLTNDTGLSFLNYLKALKALDDKNTDAFVQALLSRVVKNRIARGESSPKLPR